jgi:hypothetical protein
MAFYTSLGVDWQKISVGRGEGKMVNRARRVNVIHACSRERGVEIGAGSRASSAILLLVIVCQEVE